MLNNNLFNRHLEDDEQVVVILHKHWFNGVRELFLPIVALLALVTILALSPERYVALTVGILLVVTVVWLLRNFFDYYLDAWIITNTSIIDVEWHGWFHRESSRILYSDIQGVSYEVKGIWQTLFQTGTISVEKVSTGNAISLHEVKRPKRIEKTILHQMEQYLHQHNMRDANTIQDLLVNVLAKEMQKKDFPKIT